MTQFLNKTPIYIKLIKDHTDYDDSITFYFSDFTYIKMYHEHPCCESGYIEDINGALDRLLYKPILQADEKISYYDPKDPSTNLTNIDFIDSATWTFYTLAGPRGYVDIRWCVESNGYCSESVDFKFESVKLEDLPSDIIIHLCDTHPELVI